MEIAAAIVAIVVILGGVLLWIAIAKTRTAATQKERRRQAEEAGKARERFDEAYRDSRGGALKRARDLLRNRPG